MYLWVVGRKVDKGLSLREASKSINISHKQILDWKKQVEKMKSKNNQHAKSLGDGVTSFLSLYTDSLLSFIFEMRETGMAVSVNSIVLKVCRSLAGSSGKRLSQQGTQPCIDSSMYMVSCIGWGHTYPNVNLLRWKRLPLISYV